MNAKEKVGAIMKHMQNMGQINPEWMESFQNFMQQTKKEGALSNKMKELIGIALSVKGQCDRCIAWHVQKALTAGATKEEIVEASLVAVVMSGGPGLMYMEDVMKAIEDLSEEK